MFNLCLYLFRSKRTLPSVSELRLIIDHIEYLQKLTRPWSNYIFHHSLPKRHREKTDISFAKVIMAQKRRSEIMNLLSTKMLKLTEDNDLKDDKNLHDFDLSEDFKMSFR